MFEKEGAANVFDEKEQLTQALYAQIGELKVPNDFQKKSIVKSLTYRRMLVDSKYIEFIIVKQCELMEVNRSSFYYESVAESEDNLSIMRVLDEQYFKTSFYGLEILLVLLILNGYKINKKRLRMLMKIQGWKTLYCKPRTTRIDRSYSL